MSSNTTVKKLVLEVLSNLLSNPINSIELNQPLGQKGLGLDSIGFLDLVLNVEKGLDIRLRTEDLNSTALETVDSFITHIEDTFYGSS